MKTIKGRVPGRKGILLLAAVLVIGAGTATFAVARSGSGGKGVRAGAAALLQVSCGAQVQSIVRTENSPSSTNSTAFVLVPGANISVVVPAGATRCIKVLFTAKAWCPGPAAVSDQCQVRAFRIGPPAGGEMNPQGAGFQTLVSEDTSPNGHAFEWVQRVGAGTHTIQIHRRVSNAGTAFPLDDWTLDVQVHG